MKKIGKIILILSVLFFLESTTDKKETEGIIFLEVTWQQALKKSVEERKPIFLSLSTSWCGWCKKMKQNVFSDKQVGIYFNKNFINVELDGEQGEGLRLAHKFGVTEYPTLFLVDKSENQLFSTEGYHEADDLIKLFKSVDVEKK